MLSKLIRSPILNMRYPLECEFMKLMDKFPFLRHKSNKKFMFLYVLALIKSRSVQFCETATHLNSEVKDESNENRIQDFFRTTIVDYKELALLFYCTFPCHQKLDIIIDRTEWDFGKSQHNILMIIISNRTVAIPFYWEMLDNKSGNSNTSNRIELVQKCLSLIPASRISVVLGDREFIGHDWFKYLKDNNIQFCFRIPKNHHIMYLDEDMNEQIHLASSLQTQYPKGIIFKDYFVDGICGNVYVGTDKSGELLFLFGTFAPKTLPKYYERRWTIETIFQDFKGRGFNLENTHLRDAQKLKKLIACVSLAYNLCKNIGVYKHKKKRILIKKHGRKKNSFFRTGLNYIRNLFKKKEELCRILTIVFRTITINLARLTPFLSKQVILRV